MRNVLWAVFLVAVILIAGTMVIYFRTSINSNNSTVTAPIFPGYSAIATDSNSSIGIDLSLALNSTTIKQGQDIQTIVQVLNTLPRVNKVTVGNHFPIRPLNPKCLPGDYTPIVVQMYSGIYNRGNISRAQPLPYFLTCPSVSSNSLIAEYYYIIQPNSANATLYGHTYSGYAGNTGPMSLRIVNQISIHQFSSSFPNSNVPDGVYTLVVEDWWGQMVILQFSIAA